MDKKYRAKINMSVTSGVMHSQEDIDEFIEIYKDNFEEVSGPKKTAEELVIERIKKHQCLSDESNKNNKEVSEYYRGIACGYRQSIALLKSNGYTIISTVSIKELAEKIRSATQANCFKACKCELLPSFEKKQIETIKQVLIENFPAQPDSITLRNLLEILKMQKCGYLIPMTAIKTIIQKCKEAVK